MPNSHRKRKKSKNHSASSSEIEVGDTNSVSKISKKNSNGKDHKVQLPYVLDRMKAIHKKIDGTSSLKSKVDIKGKAENPQITIECDTARYEVFKNSFPHFIESSGLTSKNSYKKDRTGLTILYNSTIYKEGDVLYTINFYNTTNKLLVNHTTDIDIFLKHYEELSKYIADREVFNMNKKIRASCEEFLEQCEDENEPGKGNGRDESVIDHSYDSDMELGENQYSCSTNNEKIVKKNVTTNKILSTAQISNGSVMKDGRDERRQSVKTFATESVLDLESVELNDVNPSIVNLLKKLSNQIQLSNEKICSLENQVGLLRCENDELRSKTYTIEKKLETVGNQSQARIWSNVAKNNLPSTSNQTLPNLTKPNQTTPNPTKPKQTTPNHSFDKDRSNYPQITNNEFVPNQNIIVSIQKDSEISKKFDQDSIRRVICKHFGPTIIEKVTRYKYNTDTPKISIQFQDTKTAENIASNWKTHIFGSSSARTTINPASFKENTVMMYGVPIDCNDTDIESDVTSMYEGSVMQRLLKDGKRLRTFKIKFSSSSHYYEAISNGILLNSQSIKCHCKPING